MAHKIYHTDGFILSSLTWGEANRMLIIFTEQLGVISVLAQGVRESRSKMRHHLYQWTPLKLSLVRGREMWRLIGVEVLGSPPSVKVRPILIRVGRLLKRLLPEQASSPEVFNLIKSGVPFLNLLVKQAPTESKLAAGELLLVLRLLTSLGYLPKLEILPKFVWANDWDQVELGELLNCRQEAITLINDALSASQL